VYNVLITSFCPEYYVTDLYAMLSDEERKFMAFWEKNRERQNKLSYQLWSGLPWGIIFALPIFINFLLGRFWYKRADAVAMSQFNPFVLIFAVILIAIFIGVFQKKHKWEMHEQKYRELKSKENQEKNERTSL
jgi:amino acid permease